MNILDIRTIFLGFLVSSAICLIVMVPIWWQNRRHLDGLGFWLIDFACQFCGLLLFLLRGSVPDFLSIFVANFLIIGGTVLLYYGLGRYVKMPVNLLPDALLLAGLLFVLAYLLYVQPNLTLRTQAGSVALFVVCAQCAWLMLGRVEPGLRPETRAVGLVMAAYCVTALMRIVGDLIQPQGNDLFKSGVVDGLALLIYQLLFIAVTYTLVQMVSRRLYTDLAHDMAERQRVETALRQSEANYRSLAGELERRVQIRTAELQDLYDSAPTGYHSLDTEGCLVLINQTELNWLGYSREAVIGRPFKDFLAPQSWPVFEQAFARFKAQGWVRDVEFECLRSDGSTYPILLNSIAVRDGSGAVVMSRSTVIDNTERKLAEQALRESLEQNRLLVNESPDAVTLYDDQARLVEMNPAYAALTGYTAEQLLGRSIRDVGLVPAEKFQAWRAGVDLPRRTGDLPVASEIQIMRADGELRDVAIRVFALTLRNRQHYLVNLHDITAQKQFEATLSLANAELERAMHMKDEFLASMSHELRTPLTGILGMAEVLEMGSYGELNARQARAVGTIQASGQHLLDLISDILDLSQIESGRLDLQPEVCLLAEVCQASLKLTQVSAQGKRQQVSFSIEPVEIILLADKLRLKQMLVNLLNNAIKFTPEDGELGLEVRASPEERLVRLTVWDKGIGIKPEDQKRLFKHFIQLDGSLARSYSGTGLGLSLVQRMAEMHGGSVQVESALGNGSRFTISLPWDPETSLQPAAAPASVETGETDAASGVEFETAPLEETRLVLVVDDNDLTIEVLSEYLQAQHYHVMVARSGYEALDLALAARPDIILMDIQMPGIDGLETIRRIRAHPDSQFARTPTLAITALALSGDGERCLAAGADGYLSKPLRLSELAALMRVTLDG